MGTESGIPEELFEMNILIRLPVKSLLRFKCVCKSWYAIIKNPIFITAHKRFQQNNNVHVLINHWTPASPCVWNFLSEETLQPEESMLDFQFPISQNSIKDVRILGSSSVNGIICMLLNHSHIFVLNPATRESTYIQGAPFDQEAAFDDEVFEEIVFEAVVLDEVAFEEEDPEEPDAEYPCYSGFGFGYDVITNEYKVVRSFDCFAEVYNFGSSSWRRLDANIDWYYADYEGFLLNGMYHWMAGYCNGEKFLISFDMSTEVFHKTYMPYLDEASREIKQLYPLSESVAVLTCNGDVFDGNNLEVWILGEVNTKESWTKLFTLSQHPDLIRVQFPLIGYGKNSEIFFVEGYLYGYQSYRVEDVILYNHSNKTSRKLGFKMHPKLSAAATYSESLVSLRPKGND